VVIKDFRFRDFGISGFVVRLKSKEISKSQNQKLPSSYLDLKNVNAVFSNPVSTIAIGPQKKVPGGLYQKYFPRRRKFLHSTRHVSGRGFTAPSDKLNSAGTGAGGKAEVNLPYAYTTAQKI
jgi:hypothetical protein